MGARPAAWPTPCAAHRRGGRGAGGPAARAGAGRVAAPALPPGAAPAAGRRAAARRSAAPRPGARPPACNAGGDRPPTWLLAGLGRPAGAGLAAASPAEGACRRPQGRGRARRRHPASPARRQGCVRRAPCGGATIAARSAGLRGASPDVILRSATATASGQGDAAPARSRSSRYRSARSWCATVAKPEAAAMKRSAASSPESG